MSFSFAAFTPPAPLDSGKDRILVEWKELEDRVIAEAKCIPDDKEELQEEWRMWCERWADIMRALSNCTDRGRAQNVILTMSGEARAAGLGANEQYERWTRERGALKALREGSTGGSASLAPRINCMKMEVAIPSKSTVAQKLVTHNPPYMRCVKVKKECVGEDKRSCNGCNAVHQKCEYASFRKAMGLKGKVSDAPTLSASASGSLHRTVSSPGLAVPSGSEPEIVEAPVKRATRNTRKAAEPKGKGKGKAKEVVPATPTVEESSDEVSHYEKG
ncbi:uncharacterized protein EDB91DRAFT_1252335 [Suillus paluster]|uniref:uncharacterized protein n=1 Tax=Suillus paluster TaxID=48578 RepID=UPI001B85FBF1|nr:uncharacterized protein EDB91DRAFT_1252335 [Suillus paluster]KAG1731083.1 hypothetical protein EDB91DRAFT_1252335 [Suillus paluster]